jgi:hypothetical protein
MSLIQLWQVVCIYVVTITEEIKSNDRILHMDVTLIMNQNWNLNSNISEISWKYKLFEM